MNFAPQPAGAQLSSLDYANQYVNRNAWIITTERWFNAGKFIALPLNPEAVEFTLPIRVAHETTHAAKYVYVWRRRSTKNVINSFVVSFSISSGNILPAFDISTEEKLRAAKAFTGVSAQPIPPSPSYAADVTRGSRVYAQPRDGGGVKVNGLYDKIVPLGVQNLYALLGLVEDVNTYNTGNGVSSNRVVVGMSTLLFPQLLLYGNITPDGITVSMSADNPAEFTVNFSLLVQSSYPKLGYDSWAQLTSTYKDTMFSNSQTLDWMQAVIRHRSTPASAGSSVGPAAGQLQSINGDPIV